MARRLGVASTLALAVLGATAVPAQPEPEACSWRFRADAAKKQASARPPLAIGDSVMGWAVKPLGAAGFKVDARMCRMWPEGREIVARLRERGKLPRRIVMALGSNWQIPMEEIERMLPLLKGRHTLAIVSPRENGGAAGQDAENVRKAARRHPRKIKLLDWVRYSDGKDHWFGGDGLHLKREYADRYVSCIKQALPRYRKRAHRCSPG